MRTSSPRILITRLSALGDTILTLPVLCALRKAMPRAQIGWVAEPAAANVLAERSDLNFLFTVQKNWLKKPAEIGRLRRSLLRHQFEYVIDVQGLAKSSLAGWLSGRARQITFERGQARECAPWLATERVPATKTYIADRYLELLAPLGIENPKREFCIPVDSIARASLYERLPFGRGTSYAVLNVGAGWFSKTWLPHRFGEVAAHLHRVHGLPSVLLWGSPTEKAYAHSAKQAADRVSPDSAVVCPKLTITQMKELIRGGQVLVSGDTGPLHFGVALDTPTVSLFGVTDAKVYSPCRGIHRAVQKDYDSLSCRKRRKANNTAMRSISTADVVQELDHLLSVPFRNAA